MGLSRCSWIEAILIFSSVNCFFFFPPLIFFLKFISLKEFFMYSNPLLVIWSVSIFPNLYLISWWCLCWIVDFNFWWCLCWMVDFNLNLGKFISFLRFLLFILTLLYTKVIRFFHIFLKKLYFYFHIYIFNLTITYFCTVSSVT